MYTSCDAQLNAVTTALIQIESTRRVFWAYHLDTALCALTVCVLKAWTLLSQSLPAVLYKLKLCALLHYFALVIGCTLLTAGCSVLPNQFDGKVNYANPPNVDTWLQSQRELVACETVLAARHMADFGFFHPQCKQLIDIGPQDYLVESREIVHLKEGPMWLLNVKHNSRIYFVPIPWHDWL